jgi:hypothetical protein
MSLSSSVAASAGTVNTGLVAHVARHNTLAQYLVSLIDAVPDLARMASVELSIVCFRYGSEKLRGEEEHLDVLNKQVREEAQVGGNAFMNGALLSRTDFDAVEPLAGCMALTTFFYWMLAYGSVPEKIAAVSASEDIFIQICAWVGPALMHNYGMSAEQVAFFTAHEEARK